MKAIDYYNKIINIDGLGGLIGEYVKEVEKGEFYNLEVLFYRHLLNFKRTDYNSPNRELQLPDVYDKPNGTPIIKLPIKDCNIYVNDEPVLIKYCRNPNNKKSEFKLVNYGRRLELNLTIDNRRSMKEFENIGELLKMLKRMWFLRDKYYLEGKYFDIVDMSFNDLTFLKNNKIESLIEKHKIKYIPNRTYNFGFWIKLYDPKKRYT